jgi:hypothetical protein
VIDAYIIDRLRQRDQKPREEVLHAPLPSEDPRIPAPAPPKETPERRGVETIDFTI